MEEMASEFIVGTCQLLPKCYDSVSDCMYDPLAHAVHCGSAMELYIRPLTYNCIDDIDALIFETDELAFEGDLPELPYDENCLRDTIRCYKIEPYLRYPGFVRLRTMRKLKYNWRIKKYEFNSSTLINGYHRFDNAAKAAELDIQFKCCSRPSFTVRGPAITMNETKYCPVDNVGSIWCPQWPKEAQEWPKRPRNNGWPTDDTISEVIRNGCHVVYVQHRACRDFELQWRFSFSVAEVILLQSWTKIQQIVYHLLRVFAKSELIQKDCPKEDEVLCTYHLKTLMLWSCEEMSSEWWNSSYVIAICCELLKRLSEWLKRRHCPNYFIPEANLFNLPVRSARLEKTERQLNEFCNCGSLCNWFVENCILPFTREYIEGVDTRSITPNFVEYIIPILQFQQTLKLKSLDYLFSRGILNCNIYIRYLMKFGINLGPKSCLSYTCVVRKFALVGHGSMAVLPVPEDVGCFTLFDTALCSLNAAYGLQCGKMAWDSELFFKYIKGFCSQPKSVKCHFHRLPMPIKSEGSQFHLWQAHTLMENLTGLNGASEFQLLSLLSKGLLGKALKCDDFQSNGLALATTVYLAALHFATSEYQIVIDLCSSIFIGLSTHIENETLNAGCLFFIDDVVRIVGFYLLCKKFRENDRFTTRRQVSHDLRLTPKVFAYYLAVILVEKLYTQVDLIPYSPTSVFPLDEFLFAVVRRRYHTLMKSSICLQHDPCPRAESVAANFAYFINLLKIASTMIDFNAAEQCVYSREVLPTGDVSLTLASVIMEEILIDVLMKYALEHIKLFYRAICRDFGIQCNTIDCYLALYLYKLRQYDETLHLCERIMKEPDPQSDFKNLALTNVLVIPSLHLLFDGDVQSLLGFHSLFWNLSPLIDNARKSGAEASAKYGQLFALFVFCSTKSLSYCFSFPDSIRCHYSLGRHFLANYLKLRCCIDCNQMYTQAMAEFVGVLHTTIGLSKRCG